MYKTLRKDIRDHNQNLSKVVEEHKNMNSYASKIDREYTECLSTLFKSKCDIKRGKTGAMDIARIL